MWQGWGKTGPLTRDCNSNFLNRRVIVLFKMQLLGLRVIVALLALVFVLPVPVHCVFLSIWKKESAREEDREMEWIVRGAERKEKTK